MLLHPFGQARRGLSLSLLCCSLPRCPSVAWRRTCEQGADLSGSSFFHPFCSKHAWCDLASQLETGVLPTSPTIGCLNRLRGSNSRSEGSTRVGSGMSLWSSGSKAENAGRSSVQRACSITAPKPMNVVQVMLLVDVASKFLR